MLRYEFKDDRSMIDQWLLTVSQKLNVQHKHTSKKSSSKAKGRTKVCIRKSVLQTKPYG